jgi:hypothetical protein
MWLGYHLPRIPTALIQGISLEQDYLCRCIGDCLFGEELDTEVGNLIGRTVPGLRWFGYVRYNRSFLGDEARQLLSRSRGIAQLDAIHAIPFLREIGRAYAEKHVAVEHLI